MRACLFFPRRGKLSVFFLLLVYFLFNSTRASMTAVGDHLRNTRHALDLSSSSIVVREDDTFIRRIRDAIEIHCQAPIRH